MNLNIDVICHELQKKYAVYTAAPSADSIPLSCPLLYDGTAFRKNHVYIMEATDFAFLGAYPADIALIVIGMSLIQPETCPCNILFIREKVPYQIVFNQVAEIFDRMNGWEQELLQYEGDYEHIQQMLACSHDILGGRLTLVDNSFNLLAYTNDLLQYPEYYDSSTPTRTPVPLIESALEDPYYRSCMRKRMVFLYPEYICDANILCYNLFREEEDIYYARLLLMNDSNQYTAMQACLLQFLGEMIHRTLSRVSTISMVRSAYQDMDGLIRRVLKEPPRLSIGYREALAALELGNTEDPSLWCYYFGSYVISYIIQASSREIPFSELINDRLFVLKDYDRKNGSQLFETLKTYIKCKYNVTRSAEALFIHRTTFLSRFERITQLTQLDLDDWNTRLSLMLSIHALENS